jgi:transglutaminase-like putative cysteine protease
MLRRRGIASRVCLGVAREQGNLVAHAWVEVGGDNIVTSPGTSTLTRLAEFGG